MATTADIPRASAPWHLWAVGVIGLLWNGYGGYDYTMSHLQGEAYYRQSGMTDAQIALMDTYPTWMHAVWAVGVWGAVAGSVLLLLRMRWAAHAFALSMVGVIGNILHTALTPAARESMGLVFPLVIGAVTLFFLWYAWTMTKRGVLR
ncbi:MAG: hypothetical protein GC203_23430 [Phenylobacterium sp.]|uniref:hypothetical protein n=1 Tax=Phenylobacterium sp. TaxID=1871053 RepID=UPI002600631A|nr:hypothetical protein [Phenylobacterium sp.]MBI1200827.1 hypothetical protein [Phenylobacterium sp.]